MKKRLKQVRVSGLDAADGCVLRGVGYMRQRLRDTRQLSKTEHESRRTIFGNRTVNSWVREAVLIGVAAFFGVSTVTQVSDASPDYLIVSGYGLGTITSLAGGIIEHIYRINRRH